MDEIALLRRMRDDVAPPSPAAISAGRQMLTDRIAAASSGTDPSGTRSAFGDDRGISRRTVVITGAGVIAASVSALLAVGSPAAPAADGADVLHRAAGYASMAPQTEAGSVIEVTVRSLDFIEADSDEGVDVAARREIVTMARTPRPGEPWLRKRASISYEYAYGDRSLLPKDMQPVPVDSPQRWMFESSKLGTFVGNPQPRSEAGLGDYPDEIQDLPRDPDELLRALKTFGVGAGIGTAWEVLPAAERVLTSGAANSGLRAAIFAALQKMPDIAILDRHVTDLEGRTGVAIGVEPGTPDPSGDHNAAQLIIDPDTGQYLGSRAILLRRSGPVPAGVEMYASTVRYDVATTEADWTPPAGNHLVVYP